MKILYLLGLVFLSALVMDANAVKLTMYDDGRSCPAECDAHVVFHPSLNGSQYAHLPDSEDSNYQKCTNGELCEICFKDARQECISVVYRGNGPGEDTFDLTPAFYMEWCGKSDIPETLRSKCADLESDSARLLDRINCIANPSHEQCVEMMTAAEQSKQEDTVLYEECVARGQSRFNEGKPKSEQRVYACSYEAESTGGPNSRGLKWKRLLPGACRENTFVGRDGLDCCSGNIFADGHLGRECRSFYPEAIQAEQE